MSSSAVLLPITKFPVLLKGIGRTKLDQQLASLGEFESFYKWQSQQMQSLDNGNTKSFTLLDGPPYANGEPHVGHAINKLLKDFILRSRVQLGHLVRMKSSTSTSSKSPRTIAEEAAHEMEQYFQALNNALIKHLSLNVNLKAYEDLSVTLENGETHRLIKFARISLKTPNGPIVLNLADNPAAIKPARIAIQNMAENVTPQVDGIIIHVPIPKLTRERREVLAQHSAKLVLNEYKLALNEVFKKYSKLLERSSNNKELIKRLNNGLLAHKRHWDKMGEDKVKERRQMLLKEIDF
ncbi:hypothetical protein niasHS_013892 [Heterodera schachtii]|uniref:Ribosome-recycling factor, mitochondrial n=1 Tax=Heterodera schachtii TaxID=97005 RepID=A0ABD2IP51_HETSC